MNEDEKIVVKLGQKGWSSMSVYGKEFAVGSLDGTVAISY